MNALLQRFWRDDDGQDMVEYALLLSFIVVCAAAVLTSTRTQMSATWSTINSSLSSAISNATGS
jgi:Flp pilus assembly pilin Flp